MSAPSRAGASSAASAAASASAGSARMSSVAIGAAISSDFRNARAGFGVSTTQCRSARATAIVRAGSTSAGGTTPSRLGTR